MRDKIKSGLRISAGIVLILLGVLGLILPIVPGWVLIIPGILLLGPKTRVAKWLLGKIEWLKHKFKIGKAHHETPRKDNGDR